MPKYDCVQITSPIHIDRINDGVRAGVLSPTSSDKGHPTFWTLLDRSLGNRFQMGVRRIDGDTCDLKIKMFGKALGERCLELITKENFLECLNTVRSMSGVNFDPDAVISQGKCNELHVTEDVRLSVSFQQRQQIMQMLRKPNEWLHEKKFRNSHGIMHRIRSEQLKLYDKGNLMRNADEQRYLKEVKLPGNAYEGITRIENKLQNRNAIKYRFGVPDTRVETIFASTENPLASTLRDIFDLDAFVGTLQNKRIGVAEKLVFMEYYNNDLAKIEQVVRSIDPANTARAMKTYYALYKEQNEGKPNTAEARAILNNIISLVEHAGIS